MSPEQGLRFVPSRVEGLSAVTEVTVDPDRLVLVSEGQAVVFPFAAFARWPWPRWWWRLLAWLGWRPHRPAVADRDWFHAPADRFFAFFTTPPIVVYMPDERGVEYARTYFRRVQDVLGAGGYSTFDLG
jgi:hypothetical protein